MYRFSWVVSVLGLSVTKIKPQEKFSLYDIYNNTYRLRLSCLVRIFDENLILCIPFLLFVCAYTIRGRILSEANTIGGRLLTHSRSVAVRIYYTRANATRGRAIITVPRPSDIIGYRTIRGEREKFVAIF